MGWLPKTFEKLTETNWESWVVNADAVLGEQELWSYIIKKQPKYSSDPTERMLKDTKEKRAESLITLMCTPAVQSKIRDVQGPQAKWEKLRLLYGPYGTVTKEYKEIIGSNPSDAIGSNPSDAIGSNPSDAIGRKTSDAIGRKTSDAIGTNPSDAIGHDPSHAIGTKPSHAIGSNPSDAIGSNPSDAIGHDPNDAIGSNPSDAMK